MLSPLTTLPEKAAQRSDKQPRLRRAPSRLAASDMGTVLSVYEHQVTRLSTVYLQRNYARTAHRARLLTVSLRVGQGCQAALLNGEQSAFCRNPVVGKEFPVECHHHAITRRVGLFLQVDAEVDRAHDPVAELLMDELFDRPAVYLQRLVEPVNGRVSGNRGGQPPAHGRRGQHRDRRLVETQQLNEHLAEFGGNRVLAE